MPNRYTSALFVSPLNIKTPWRHQKPLFGGVLVFISVRCPLKRGVLYSVLLILSVEERSDAVDEGVREKESSSFEPRSQQDEQQHVRQREREAEREREGGRGRRGREGGREAEREGGGREGEREGGREGEREREQN